jgi:hypothetical protein
MKKRKFDSFLKSLKLDEFEYKTKESFIVEPKKVSYLSSFEQDVLTYVLEAVSGVLSYVNGSNELKWSKFIGILRFRFRSNNNARLWCHTENSHSIQEDSKEFFVSNANTRQVHVNKRSTQNDEDRWISVFVHGLYMNEREV